MPQKQKISLEIKIEIIEECIKGNISTRALAQKYDISATTVKDWVRNYKSEGIAAVLPHKNRTYSTELKAQAVVAYLSGEGSIREICKRYNIRDTKTLRAWIKRYNSGGDLGSIKHSGGGSYMKPGRTTTKEDSVEIAKACITNGKNYGEIALKYQVSYQQARNWTKRYEELGEVGLEDRRGKRKKDQDSRTELEKAQIEIERKAAFRK